MESRATIIILVVCCVIITVAGIIFAFCKGGEPTPLGDDTVKKPLSMNDPQSLSLQDPSKADPQAEAKPLPVVQASYEMGTKQDQALVRQSVDEPFMPLSVEKGRKYDYVPLQKGSGFLFERTTDEGEKVSGVVIPGFVLLTSGYVELFGCGDRGKTHETIIQLDCDIQTLDLAFTLAGFERGSLPDLLKKENPDQGTRVVALVQWTDKDGSVITRRSEDLVISVVREKPMPRIGWTYVGKWEEVPNPSDPDRTDKVLGAAMSRSLVTTWRDTSSLLDNPLPEAPDDAQFTANYMVLPRNMTPVRIIFRKPVRAEREEIAKLEESICESGPVPFHEDDREHGGDHADH